MSEQDKSDELLVMRLKDLCADSKDLCDEAVALSDKLLRVVQRLSVKPPSHAQLTARIEELEAALAQIHRIDDDYDFAAKLRGWPVRDGRKKYTWHAHCPRCKKHLVITVDVSSGPPKYAEIVCDCGINLKWRVRWRYDIKLMNIDD